MNVARYSASGTTQSNGAETTSVARCCVTPSSSADGTSASRIHSARRDPTIAWLPASAGRLPPALTALPPEGGRPILAYAQAATSAATAQKPAAQPVTCALRVATG